MTVQKGIFIVFEGIDGSGKSTQMQLLKNNLITLGYKVHDTFEPTNNKIGSILRSIIKGDDKADNRTIASLFAADRLHHILNEQDGILKKLNDGFIVLCDRYYFSSFAYHSVFMDMDWVIALNSKSMELLKPTIHLFLDVDANEAIKRINTNRSNTELYESSAILHKVYENYLIAFEKYKNEENIIKINCAHSIAAIANEILIQTKKYL